MLNRSWICLCISLRCWCSPLMAQTHILDLGQPLGNGCTRIYYLWVLLSLCVTLFDVVTFLYCKPPLKISIMGCIDEVFLLSVLKKLVGIILGLGLEQVLHASEIILKSVERLDFFMSFQMGHDKPICTMHWRNKIWINGIRARRMLLKACISI